MTSSRSRKGARARRIHRRRRARRPVRRRHNSDATVPNTHTRSRTYRMAFATTAVKATRAPTLASTRVQRRKPTMRCVRASANKVRESVDVRRGCGMTYEGESDDATMRWETRKVHGTERNSLRSNDVRARRGDGRRRARARIERDVGEGEGTRLGRFEGCDVARLYRR